MNKWKWLAFIILPVAIVVYGIYHFAIRPRPFPARPNIIIYLVDTLRRDHLSVYGYGRKTSPNLEEFRKDSVLFENAYTPAPWTRPATASLLSGLLPRTHGAVSKMEKIHDRVRLLGEYLHQAGYKTAFFNTNPQVLPVWGFGRGFDAFLDIRKGSADKVIERVLEKMPEFSNGKQPFFLYIHTLDPHGPNNPPEPFRSMWPRNFKKIRKSSDINPKTRPDVVEDMIAAYDEEIARNDHYFGILMQYLQKHNLYDDTWIFYVADHGEEFQDHGYGGHCHSMYQELLRIPMLMKLPGNRHANETVNTRVWLPDVVPTILPYVKQVPNETLPGISLMKFVEAKATVDPRTLFFDLDTERADGTPQSMRAVLSGDIKYVERAAPWSERQLFDTKDDPKEKNNIFEVKRDLAEGLAKEIEKQILQNEGGTYLHFVNDESGQTLKYEGVLRTEAEFRDIRSWQFEGTDSATLEDGKKALRFTIQLQNAKSPIHPSQWVIDEDTVSFRVEPPDAQVRLTDLVCTGCPQNGLYIGQDRKFVQTQSLPLNISQSEKVFWISAPTVHYAQAGGYLFIVPYVKKNEVHLDKDTEERLRSLGYLQ